MGTDGYLYNEGGTIGTATVNGNGRLKNDDDGYYGNSTSTSTIGTVTVNDNGYLSNYYGTIGNVTVNDNGRLENGSYNYNYGNRSIGTATVNDNGFLVNSGGTIGTATVNGNGGLHNGGTIGTATVNDNGFLVNSGGTIGTATINDAGRLYAEYNTIFDKLTLNNLDNVESFYGSVNDLTLNHVRSNEYVNVNQSSVGNIYSQSNFSSLTFGDIQGTVRNEDVNINTATVNGYGYLGNYGGTVGTVTVNGYGRLDSSYGTIGTATVSGYGRLQAYDTVFDKLTLNNLDNVESFSGSSVNDLTLNHVRSNEYVFVNQSSVGNIYSQSNFSSLAFDDIQGTVQNYDGSITAATVNGNGYLDNYGGTVGTATVNGDGRLYSSYGTIGTATINDAGRLSAHDTVFDKLTLNNIDNVESFYDNSVNDLTLNHVRIGEEVSVSQSSVQSSYYNYGWTNWKSIESQSNFSSLTFGDIQGTVRNEGVNINTATVNGNGRLENNYGGTIDTATVNGNGYLENYGGTVGTATVNGNGGLYSSGGTIGTATVNDAGRLSAYDTVFDKLTLNNLDNVGYIYGSVNDLTLNHVRSNEYVSVNQSGGGNIYSQNGFSSLTFGDIQGTVQNYDGSSITAATVNGDGRLYSSYGTIGTVTVNDYGYLYSNVGTIGTATVNDAGRLSAYDTIFDKLTLNNLDNVESFYGSVNDLTLNHVRTGEDVSVYQSSVGNIYQSNFSSLTFGDIQGTVRNYDGSITAATVNGNGRLENNYGGTIDTATVNDYGYLYSSSGTVGTVTVNGDGRLYSSYGTIGTAIINDAGRLYAEYNTIFDKLTLNNLDNVESFYGSVNDLTLNHVRIGENVSVEQSRVQNTSGKGIEYQNGFSSLTFNDIQGTVRNEDGSITAATVNGYGRLENNYGGTIDTATVNDYGYLYSSSGTVGNATVNGYGRLENNYGGTIDTATVNDYGYLYSSSGTVGTVTVNGYGRLESNSGTIGNATVNGYGRLQAYDTVFDKLTLNNLDNVESFSGSSVNDLTLNHVRIGEEVSVNQSSVQNTSGKGIEYQNGFTFLTFGDIQGTVQNQSGSITAATVNGYGRLENNYGGTIDTATVNDYGYLYNDYGGTIGTVTVNSGSLYSLTGTIGTAIINDAGRLSAYDTVFDKLTLNNLDNVEHVSGSVNDLTLNHVRIGEDVYVNQSSVQSSYYNYGWTNWKSIESQSNFSSLTFGDIQGTVQNYGGSITAATVNDNGRLESDGGTVGTATINDAGRLWAENTVFDKLTLNNLDNVESFSGNSVNDLTLNHVRIGEEVSVSQSSVQNNRGKGIESQSNFSSLTFNDIQGTVHNEGSITAATVNDNGYLHNANAGTIGNATVNGGTLQNDGWVGAATLRQNGLLTGTGSIDNLHVTDNAAFDAAAYSGIIGNLTFDGSGLLLISGSLGDFSTVNVSGQVDLTGAKIVLDFSSASAQSVPLAAAFTAPALFDAGVLSAAAGSPSFADDFSFDIAGIFNFIGEDAGFVNAAEWWETIDSVQLLTSGGSEYLLTSFGGGVFGSGEAESSTPEPATLLILGLGLAGLGLARRRRK